MMTYRISRNICIQHEEIFDLLVNYSTLHYIKILWIHNTWVYDLLCQALHLSGCPESVCICLVKVHSLVFFLFTGISITYIKDNKSTH